MIHCIRTNVLEVSIFLFVVNGSDIRWDSNTANLIKIFEDNFGSKFWNHFAIAYSMWSFHPINVKKRER